MGNRRRKKSREYKVLIVPEGEGGVTKSIGKWGFTLWGSLICAVIFLVTFLAFRYTPLGRLAGIGIVQSVDSVANETDHRIRALAEEVAILKDYNIQLRKALGENTGGARQSVETQKSEPEKIDTTKDEPAHDGQLVDDEYNVPAVTEIHNPTSATGVQAPFPLLTPVNGIVTQGFDPNQKHYGMDFAAKEGTIVQAAAQGYVVFAGWTYEFGYTIILSHAGGYITAYKHNSSLLKSTGSFVKRGELIGLVGSTGMTSKGPHLHFEVLKDGFPADPQLYLLNSKSAL
ncbi:MAG: M23 family metallopeptidase [bacterium]